MRRFLGALGWALITAHLSATPALACADKLRVLGRAIRYQQVSAAQPASILVYLGQNMGAGVRDPHLQPALKKAGHKLHSVQDRAQLDEALKRGKYDLVVADIKDAEDLQELVQASPSRPAMLPVVSQTGSAEGKAATKRFLRVLKAPDKTGHYLTTIDEFIQLNSKAGSGKGRI